MAIIFVRHAESVGNDTNNPLTPRGRHGAEKVGRFLFENGLRPLHVLHTPKRGPVETARKIRSGLVNRFSLDPDWCERCFRELAFVRRSRLPSQPQTWARLSEELENLGDVVIVGQLASQRFVERHLGGAEFGVPSGHLGAAFVIEDGRVTLAFDGYATNIDYRIPDCSHRPRVAMRTELYKLDGATGFFADGRPCVHESEWVGDSSVGHVYFDATGLEDTSDQDIADLMRTGWLRVPAEHDEGTSMTVRRVLDARGQPMIDVEIVTPR